MMTVPGAADKSVDGINTAEDGVQMSQQTPPQEGAIPKVTPSEGSEFGRVVAVMSGKGGVGKSSVAALLAVSLRRAGHEVGVLDADITGPSIPKLFGLRERPRGAGEGSIMPVETEHGIKVMSINLLLPSEDDPVIWRGPLISSAVKQFFTDVRWGRLDYLIVDLPPGTGDAPLTVLQSSPLSGIIVVSSPQELAQLIVRKAVKMAGALKVPVLGLVENMSVLNCPHCGKPIEIFGESTAEEAAKVAGLKLLGRIPLEPALASAGDNGMIEVYRAPWMEEMPSWVA